MSTFREVLQNQQVREVHAQPRRRYLPITAEHGVWQADLMFLDESAHWNRGVNCLLNIVCIPTRYAYSIPCKGKTAPEMLRAFRVFFQEAKSRDHDVTRIECDGGPEFLNKYIKQLFNEHHVALTVVAPDDTHKKGIVERFNGTIRNWIERWLTLQHRNNWIDALPEILEYYNTRKHSTLKKAPADMKIDDEVAVRTRLREKSEGLRAVVDQLQPGDKVRVLLPRKAIGAKGRLRWSDTVHEIIQRVPNTNSFQLTGIKNDSTFKYSELQKVSKNSTDVKPKAQAVDTEQATRQHSLRLMRSQLTDKPGPAAARELIEKVNAEPVQEGPRRSTRDRRPTTRLIETMG